MVEVGLELLPRLLYKLFTFLNLFSFDYLIKPMRVFGPQAIIESPDVEGSLKGLNVLVSKLKV